MNYTLRNLVMMLVLPAMLALAGCGGSSRAIKTDLVEGTVTFEGKPVANGTVNFSPVNSGVGNPAYGNTDEQGKYKLQTLLGKADAGTTPGEYIVTISKYDSIPTGKKVKGDDGNMYDETISKPGIPEAYMDRTKTPLKRTVVSGKNTFDFALTADGK